MLMTLLPSATLVRSVQPENASYSMLMTVSGIVTLVRLVFGRSQAPSKAPLPILVTGFPSVVTGITTSPPGPVYFVIVTVPSWISQLNCACTVAVTPTSNPAAKPTTVKNRVFMESILACCAEVQPGFSRLVLRAGRRPKELSRRLVEAILMLWLAGYLIVLSHSGQVQASRTPRPPAVGRHGSTLCPCHGTKTKAWSCCTESEKISQLWMELGTLR